MEDVTESPHDWLMSEFKKGKEGRHGANTHNSGMFQVKNDMQACGCDEDDPDTMMLNCGFKGRSVNYMNRAPVCDRCWVRHGERFSIDRCRHTLEESQNCFGDIRPSLTSTIISTTPFLTEQ